MNPSNPSKLERAEWIWRRASEDFQEAILQKAADICHKAFPEADSAYFECESGDEYGQWRVLFRYFLDDDGKPIDVSDAIWDDVYEQTSGPMEWLPTLDTSFENSGIILGLAHGNEAQVTLTTIGEIGS